MAPLTTSMIIRVSGQYDKCAVQRLILEQAGLTDLSALEGCTALTDLRVSRNQLESTKGLEHVSSLVRLDLSFNKISRLDLPPTLEQLEFIDLRGNSIASIEDLSSLSRLQNLTSLTLRSVDGDSANPVCKTPDYIEKIRRLCPNLVTLDGGHVNLLDAFSVVERQASVLKKPSVDSMPSPPSEAWLPSRLVSPLHDSFSPIAPSLPLPNETTLRKQLDGEVQELLRRADKALANSAIKP